MISQVLSNSQDGGLGVGVPMRRGSLGFLPATLSSHGAADETHFKRSTGSSARCVPPSLAHDGDLLRPDLTSGFEPHEVDAGTHTVPPIRPAIPHDVAAVL